LFVGFQNAHRTARRATSTVTVLTSVRCVKHATLSVPTCCPVTVSALRCSYVSMLLLQNFVVDIITLFKNPSFSYP